MEFVRSWLQDVILSSDKRLDPANYEMNFVEIVVTHANLVTFVDGDFGSNMLSRTEIFSHSNEDMWP